MRSYENTFFRYAQQLVRREDFWFELEEWLGSLNDERMLLLKRILFEIDLSDTEELSDAIYRYGSHLTVSNYSGRRFFEQKVLFVRQLERNQGLGQ